MSFLETEYASRTIHPSPHNTSPALELTPLDTVKAVIVGQDPYHGASQAHGLCFSVPAGVKIPPSLRNICKELAADLGTPMPTSGDLSFWAKQGVLLLNAVMTVREGMPGSHAKQGWEEFSDAVVAAVSDRGGPVVFLLWGAYAQKKASLVDPCNHYILKAPHPSPLSAHQGFFGCRHFSKANEWLISQGSPGIDWRLYAEAEGDRIGLGF